MTITIPDILKLDVLAVEALYNQFQEVISAQSQGIIPAQLYEIDMSQVTFVRPYGFLALVITGRILNQISGNKILLSRMQLNVYQYLERMYLFEIGKDWFYTDIVLQEKWNRSSTTEKLLELTLISDLEDVGNVVSRAANIYNNLLPESCINRLITVLSELSTNVFEHSGDYLGCVLIQKFKVKDQAVIRLAVGDLGCGIPGSLSKHYKNICIKSNLNYLIEAMHGKTTRLSGRGGLGLRQVERIVSTTRGYLWLRSHNAAIRSYGSDRMQGFPNLAFIPGTQIAVELYSSGT